MKKKVFIALTIGTCILIVLGIIKTIGEFNALHALIPKIVAADEIPGIPPSDLRLIKNFLLNNDTKLALSGADDGNDIYATYNFTGPWSEKERLIKIRIIKVKAHIALHIQMKDLLFSESRANFYFINHSFKDERK